MSVVVLGQPALLPIDVGLFHHTLPTAPSPVTTHYMYPVSKLSHEIAPAVFSWLPTFKDCVAGAAMLAPSFALLSTPSSSYREISPSRTTVASRARPGCCCTLSRCCFVVFHVLCRCRLRWGFVEMVFVVGALRWWCFSAASSLLMMSPRRNSAEAPMTRALRRSLSPNA